jgi:hypothetical protein
MAPNLTALICDPEGRRDRLGGRDCTVQQHRTGDQLANVVGFDPAATLESNYNIRQKRGGNTDPYLRERRIEGTPKTMALLTVLGLKMSRGAEYQDVRPAGEIKIFHEDPLCAALMFYRWAWCPAILQSKTSPTSEQ